jgi:hypothetical protein
MHDEKYWEAQSAYWQQKQDIRLTFLEISSKILVWLLSCGIMTTVYLFRLDSKSSKILALIIVCFSDVMIIFISKIVG